MARTRKSDPGRVAALHYAATPRRRHAKRLVYAYFLAGWGVLSAGGIRPLAVGAQEPGAAPCVACRVLSLSPDQAATLPPGLPGSRLLIRVAAGAAPESWSAPLTALRHAGARAGLHLLGVPEADDPVLAAEVDSLVIEVGDGDRERQAFDLKRALTRARGTHPAASLWIAAPEAAALALKTSGLDSYIDGFLPVPAELRLPEDLLAPAARGAPLVARLPADTTAAVAIVTTTTALREWLPEGLVPIGSRALRCGADRPLPTWLNPQTLDLVAISRGCPAPAVVSSDVPGLLAERFDVGQASIFRAHTAAADRFAEGVDVSAARARTIEEIIARHQAAAARQAAEVRTSIASGSLTLTFEAPGFSAPITITSQTTIYEDRRQGAGIGGPRVELQQRDVRVNGVLFAAPGGVPRLPIIEPERVAAPPLAITLTDVYRYRLAGRETQDGRDCYLVDFAPRNRAAPLYAGRAWIDASTFAMVRISASQTGLRGAITASEQQDDFVAAGPGRWRLSRSNVRQTYEGASVRTPIHRLLVIDRDEVNPADFEARRAAAYASTDVMLRDTPEGYRYLKRGASKREEGVRRQDPGGMSQEAGGGRVLAGRSDRIRTFAFGVIVDPNITQPLPFAGLSYVDFNLFGTGAQFSGFFGGSYGQLAFSAPSVRGSRWQLAGRAFGIVSSYNDRAFDQGRELYTLDIRQRPAQVAVWALRPLSARSALRIEYDWDYTKFGATEVTDPAFRVPRNQNAHALRLGLDLQRAGWQASLWVSQARRIGWRPWGLAESEYRPRHAAYQRYGASLLRSQAISPRLTTRIETAVMGGGDLDRFSRFAFGTFDNRLHGYPAALVRYDRGAVLRTAVAWSLVPAVRLDLFADTAEVRDPGFGRGLRNYSGFGAAVETPAPFGTLVAVEWGYGLQGVNTSGRTGTHVVRISGYKVF